MFPVKISGSRNFSIFVFKQRGLMIQGERNWVFVTNSDFLITMSFEPNVSDLRYFKLWILLDQIIWVWNIKGLQHRVLKILRFKYLTLFQILNSFRHFLTQMACNCWVRITSAGWWLAFNLDLSCNIPFVYCIKIFRFMFVNKEHTPVLKLTIYKEDYSKVSYIAIL